MMGWYGAGMGAWGWVGMGLGMVAFWGLVVWAVIMVTRNTRTDPPRSAPPAGPDAASILDERFARGEIDPDDYRTRRVLLHGTSD